MTTYKFTNSLINEKSPYLLGHAHNPVDWLSWSDDVFKRAVTEDKAIFLSIGYSSCHWCHVMEHECFDDEEVAESLNKDFISIKLDREERPDIDGFYMKICQMMTGRGGWPLTIIMTPQKEPYFAGTYLPKHSHQGRLGLLELLEEANHIWKNERDKLNESCLEVMESVRKSIRAKTSVELTDDVPDKTSTSLMMDYDETYGGFGDKPKFPIGTNISFLLYYSQLKNDKIKSDAALHTLKRMATGGLFDHLGGGFHRYSTDRIWLLPHFEKMLYDQATLTSAFIEAYKITGDEFYKEISQKTVDYVINDLADNGGAFYCAEDADSYNENKTEKEEGLFYVWTTKEILNILGDKDGEELIKSYGLIDEGNFRDESTGVKNGQNILFEQDLTKEQRSKLLPLRDKLLKERNKRHRPLLDDKILTDWNGLFIKSLTAFSTISSESKYLSAAIRAEEFISNNLYDKIANTLKHRYKENDAAISGMLDDYSFYISALLELYKVTQEVNYLSKAVKITDKAIELFFDDQDGGFFQSPLGTSDVIVRLKEGYDGALPSGQSAMVMNLVLIQKYTGNIKYTTPIDKTFSYMSRPLSSIPTGYVHLAHAFSLYNAKSYELVIVTDDKTKVDKKIKGLMNDLIANLTIITMDGLNKNTLNKIAPFTKDMIQIKSNTTYYLCSDQTCSEPTNDLESVLKQLRD